MALASERFASRWDTLSFVVCILLSVAARMIPPEWGFAVAAGVRTLAVPFLYLQQQAELTRTSRARFVTVVRERDSFALVADSLSVLRNENDALRAALGLRARLPVRHVSAEVLHQAGATDQFTLLLSVGRTQGARELAPVVAPHGLVGVVTHVDDRTAVAMTWIHPDFRASAMTADGSVFGIVAPVGSEGPAGTLMELSGVPYREEIAPGTLVYTSGLGDVYPRGILLGRVISVVEESRGWSRTYLVRPAVHPASVPHVMILLGEGPDLGSAFAGELP